MEREDFFNSTKSTNLRGENDKLDYITIYNFGSSKDIINIEKSNSEREKIFTRYLPENRFISSTYKRFLLKM